MSQYWNQSRPQYVSDEEPKEHMQARLRAELLLELQGYELLKNGGKHNGYATGSIPAGLDLERDYTIDVLAMKGDQIIALELDGNYHRASAKAVFKTALKRQAVKAWLKKAFPEHQSRYVNLEVQDLIAFRQKVAGRMVAFEPQSDAWVLNKLGL